MSRFKTKILEHYSKITKDDLRKLKIAGAVLWVLMSIFVLNFLLHEYVFYYGEFRSYEEMTNFFMDNQEKFNKVNSDLLKYMALGLESLDSSSKELEKIGLTKKDIKELKKGIKGITRPDRREGKVDFDEESICYYTNIWGLSVAGEVTAYCYMKEAPVNYFKGITDSQEKPFENYKDTQNINMSSTSMIYIRLKDNWYISDVSY